MLSRAVVSYFLHALSVCPGFWNTSVYVTVMYSAIALTDLCDLFHKQCGFVLNQFYSSYG